MRRKANASGARIDKFTLFFSKSPGGFSCARCPKYRKKIKKFAHLGAQIFLNHQEALFPIFIFLFYFFFLRFFSLTLHSLVVFDRAQA